MKVNAITAGSVLLLTAALAICPAGKVMADDGTKTVHNPRGGKWGKKPWIVLEYVRTLGDPEGVDENTAFFLPACVALDGEGNIYILDSGNHRIQKFGPDGRYLASFGRKGQGPGEMVYPSRLDVDKAGNLYVTDTNNSRVQVLSPEGKETKTIKFIDEGPGPAFLLRTEPGLLVMGRSTLGFRSFSGNDGAKKALPSIARVVDGMGKTVRTIGTARDFGDELMNGTLNEAIVAVGPSGETYAVYTARNLLEKYSSAGKLLWRADRELGFSMEVQDKGKVERSGNNVSVMMPKVNTAAAALAVDDLGRVWVATFARQLRKEERAGMATGISGSVGGGRSVSYQVHGNTELRTTDAFKLEVFDVDGTLLGELPLDVFVDGIYIRGDRLFLIDKLRGARVLEYRIRNI